MKEVPAKIEHNNTWIVVKIGVGEDRIVLPDPVNKEILFKTVSGRSILNQGVFNANDDFGRA